MKLLVQVKLVILFCYFANASGIRYDFGDGRFYIGDINEFGRPSGHGELHNSSGTLGTPTYLSGDTKIFFIFQ